MLEAFSSSPGPGPSAKTACNSRSRSGRMTAKRTRSHEARVHETHASEARTQSILQLDVCAVSCVQGAFKENSFDLGVRTHPLMVWLWGPPFFAMRLLYLGQR